MSKIEENTVAKTIDDLVGKGLKSLEEFSKLNQEEVNYIVAKASVAALDNHGQLALHAVEETKRGVFEDKAIKNLFACEHVFNDMRDLKTCGEISRDEVSGIIEIAEPVGVVCGIVPTTNPTSTTIFKALISLKTRNPIVFAFHPSANQCSIATAKILYDAAVAAGAPKDCIQWIETPSLEATTLLMKHKGIATILATGGNAMVEAAYSCGKPALGVGAGNVPAMIDKDANLKQAVNDICMSKAFDNGMICASEQAAIIDASLYDEAIALFKKYKVYFVSDKEKALLEDFMFGCKAKAKNCSGAKLNAEVVGRSAEWIAKEAGFEVPAGTSILGAVVSEIGEKEPLTREKLSPVLAFIKAKDSEEGIKYSAQMVEFNGLGHSAAIHSKNKETILAFGKAVKAIRVIENAPSTFGGIGNVYNAFIPSLTLGCGSYGKNSVSGNVGAVNLLNIKKIGRRNNNMQWFKVPQRIYFEQNSVEYLREMEDVNRVVIVTDKTMFELGHVQKVIDQLNARTNNVKIEVFSDVEPDPSIATVLKGFEVMKSFEPDVIIALGGGSPMDAAKGMWLYYEKPDIDFNDLKQKFMDIRKRAFKYPKLGEKARMVCIPTTSGTGSEVTPFAVISDKVANKKYPLADYALTPDVAIIDPVFVMNLPASVTADTGMDVLTHAIEAYVSVLANDFTDGLALQAIRLVFKYLRRSVEFGAKDVEAREKMHNASAIAGMAFANSFLGINHSLAHKIGAEYHVAHGRANAILMPHVIRYNGTHPAKPAVWPKYEYYCADEKYQDIADAIGLKYKDTADAVEQLALAIEKLSKDVGIKMSFKEQDLNEKEYMDNLDKIALLAYEDQCSPANPRLPLVSEMKEILVQAFHNKK